jgi:NAD(P)-dependent dehydrogenase (short-subunit alcohol dehydrogenase family)
MRLEDKIALVTGARLGIGRAIADHLAHEGAHIIAVSRSMSPDDPVIGDVKRYGRKALAIRADVADKDDCRRMVESGLNHFGRIDVLVNNAGIYPSAPFIEITEEQWDRVLAVNLKGTFLVAQAVARQAMISQQSGRIINISSCDGKCPTPGIAHYAAAKAGVISLTKSMAMELGPYHITANAVAPGWVETPAVMQSDRWRQVVGNIPAGRLAKPYEIARVVAFLSDDESAYITGATLDVNGGLIMD